MDGKEWILDEARSQSSELGLQVQLIWGDERGNFQYKEVLSNRLIHTLIITCGGKEQILQVTNKELEYCPTDPTVQKELNKRIHRVLKALSSKSNRIGFGH